MQTQMSLQILQGIEEEDEADERRDLHKGIRRYDEGCKNRRRENIPPHQGIFRLPPTHSLSLARWRAQ